MGKVREEENGIGKGWRGKKCTRESSIIMEYKVKVFVGISERMSTRGMDEEY